jgi:hypothetical protein
MRARIKLFAILLAAFLPAVAYAQLYPIPASPLSKIAPGGNYTSATDRVVTVRGASCAATPNAANCSDVLTTVNTATGTVTSSGSPVSGNVAAFTAATNIAPATASNVVSLFSGCSGTQYLGADGNCHSASSAGVTSLTGDTFFFNNSASTGSVTLTQANHTANSVVGTLTATVDSDLSVPSCSAAGDALKWTSATGFGCNTSITAAAMPASGLTGTSLPSGITSSSLTSVGTLSSLTVSNTSTLNGIAAMQSPVTGSSGVSPSPATIYTNVNQSGTAGYIGLYEAAYEQAIGSGRHYLEEFDLCSSSYGGGTCTKLASIDDDGNEVIDGSLIAGTAIVAGSVTPAISSSTFAINLASGNNFVIALSSACPCTISNPTNGLAGQKFTVELAQDSSGSRIVGTWGSYFDFGTAGTPTLTTTANHEDVLGCMWSGNLTNKAVCSISQGF